MNTPERLRGSVRGGSGAYDEIREECNAPHKAGPFPDLEGDGPQTGDKEHYQDNENDDKLDMTGDDFGLGLDEMTGLCLTCVLTPCVCLLNELITRLEAIRKTAREEEEEDNKDPWSKEVRSKGKRRNEE